EVRGAPRPPRPRRPRPPPRTPPPPPPRPPHPPPPSARANSRLNGSDLGVYTRFLATMPRRTPI
ncbi:hypothetical protein C6Q22_14080, partial [Burkholderia multivorans]